MRIVYLKMNAISGAQLIILSALTWLCQGITVSPISSIYPSVPYYRMPAKLPPQLAYYVPGAFASATRNYAPNYVRNPQGISGNTNSAVISVLEPPINKFLMRQVNLNKAPVEPYQQYSVNHEYAYNQNQYQAPRPPPAAPPSFGFVANYEYGFPSRERDGIVRATPAPQPPGRPPIPKPKKPFATTYQVDRKQRNYKQQQDIELQQRRNKPQQHYRNSAIQVVQAPSLGPPRQRHRIINPVRVEINRLKDQHRQHFNVAEDEHPANPEYGSNESLQDTDTGYEVYKQGIGLFHDEEQNYNQLKDQFERQQHQPTEPPSYDKLKKEFLGQNHLSQSQYQTLRPDRFFTPDESSHHTDGRHHGSLQYHSDPENDSHSPGPASYAEDDISGEKYNFDSPLHDEFQNFLQKAPKFVKPVAYSNSEGYHQDDSYERTGNDDFVPYKMLASVRHTERIVHESKPDEEDPAIKERILEEGGHVVYTEQGYEDKQYDHGDEERFANYKKGQSKATRQKRSIQQGRAFPFYLASHKVIPELSPIRYAEGVGLNSNRRFYDTKTKNCDAIEFDDSTVNDEDNNITTKKRLNGLGDKLDCMREKLFGANPFDNPIFLERLVTDQIQPHYTRRKREVADVIEAEESRLHTTIYIPPQPPARPNRNSTVSTKKAAEPETEYEQNDSEEQDSSEEHIDQTSDVETSTLSSRPPYSVEFKMENFTATKPNQPGTFRIQRPPTIILLNDKTLAKIRKNPTVPIAEIFQEPDVKDSEVFIFDISKFIPKLFMAKELSHLRASEDTMSESIDDENNASKASNEKEISKRSTDKQKPHLTKQHFIFISPHGYYVP